MACKKITNVLVISDKPGKNFSDQLKRQFKGDTKYDLGQFSEYKSESEAFKTGRLLVHKKTGRAIYTVTEREIEGLKTFKRNAKKYAQNIYSNKLCK